MANKNLHAAKAAKEDEFYTQFEDVNAELDYYRDHFKDKVVYCNCDSAKSAFYLYFRIRFDFLGLKKLVATHYDEGGDSYQLVYEGGLGNYHPDMGDNNYWTSKTPLEGDGDFRSEECIAIMKDCDVVVTNPPFSLFREFIELIMSLEKDLLVLGTFNAITYKDIFQFIKNDQLWLGINNGQMAFKVPDHYEPRATRFWIDESGQKWRSLGNTCWFTTLHHFKRNEELIAFKEYTEENYPTYDNYNAIEVSKVKDIPEDYKGVMGVPITFLPKHNPNQFEIVGCSYKYGDEEVRIPGIEKHGCLINGETVYKRLFIKRKGD